MAVAAVGLGAVFVAASATALAQVGHAEAGLASGLLSTFHEFGAAIGVAVASSLAVASITGRTADGFALAFIVAAATALVAGLVALRLVPALAEAPQADQFTPAS